MIRLGIDLRHVPVDGLPGAGVSHASNELAASLQTYGKEYGVETIELRGRWRSWQLGNRVKRERIDAVFAASGAVPPLLGVPTFPWVHDVAIFSHPEWFPQSRLRRFLTTSLFLRGVRTSPHVFAVSEDTKRLLIDVANIDPKKVSVTYQGVQISDGRGVKGDYAIILGTVEPRKNIPFIVHLWDDVRRKVGRDVRLLIVGRNGWGDVESHLLQRPEHFVDRVVSPNDEERDRLVSGAKVLLLPSLHEGFGRSALEAMAFGVPVIASDRGALPEVVGDAGILLDPEDRSRWVSAIADAFLDRLDGHRGIARAALFSWERTARGILAKMKEDC